MTSVAISLSDAPAAGWTISQIGANLLRDNQFWSDTSVSYSFATSLPSGYSPSSGEGAGFSAFNGAQIAAARLALQLWDDIVPLSFSETSGGSGQIRFANTTTGPGVAWAYYPGAGVGGDVWVNPGYSYNNQLGYDDYGFLTLVHEIGHALGLDHPGEYNGTSNGYSADASYVEDSRQYTVMSYFDAVNTGADHSAPGRATSYAATPLLHDIYALQQRYGADMSTRTGDTVYGYNNSSGRSAFDFTLNSAPVVSIWDAGGNDTIDLSGGTYAARLDLNAGAFSDVLGMTQNLSIAFGALIENAKGGSAGDTITGNALANTIYGNGGDDRISGGAGSDLLYGGDGNDWLAGGDGYDLLSGGAGTDSVNYLFNLSRYAFNVLADRIQVIGEGIDDVLSDVENFLFADSSYSYSSLVQLTTRTLVESTGSTTMYRTGLGSYELGGSSVVLQFGGQAVNAGTFGANWRAVQAEANANGGYDVLWRNSADNTYSIWKVDAAGRYLDAGSGAVPAGGLASLERVFHVDLDGSGSVGAPLTTIEAVGNALLQDGGYGTFLLTKSGSATVDLQFGGQAVNAGTFGANWRAVQAEANANGGYDVLWRNSADNTYSIWKVDAAGRYLDAGSGAVPAGGLASLERVFHVDLDGSGSVGAPLTTIEAVGNALLQDGGYGTFLLTKSGSATVDLQFGGQAVNAGTFGANWRAVQAEANANGGYDVLWRNSADNTYSIWKVDAAGRYLDAGSGAVPAGGLASLERVFHVDLDGSGTIRSASSASAAMASASASFIDDINMDHRLLDDRLIATMSAYGSSDVDTPIGLESWHAFSHQNHDLAI